MNIEKWNEEVERVAQFAFEKLCFADYPHCETVHADTRVAHEVISRIKSLRRDEVAQKKQE